MAAADCHGGYISLTITDMQAAKPCLEETDVPTAVKDSSAFLEIPPLHVLFKSKAVKR